MKYSQLSQFPLNVPSRQILFMPTPDLFFRINHSKEGPLCLFRVNIN